MLRAVIYARFSSQHQHQESIEAQIAECTAYCQRKGYMIVRTYADEALSGTSTAKRASYNSMLADARKGLFDVVIFHKIDRNARNEIDYFNFKRSILMMGLSYEYAGQQIDSSPEGQFMETVMVGQAAYYSRNLSKETKIKAIPFAKKSRFMGGKPPLGYRIVDKKYEIDEQEAVVIRDIFRLVLDGKSYAYILDLLNAAGYRTRHGKPFGKNSLHDILRNYKYCGTYIYNKTIKRPNGSRNSHGVISSEAIINKEAIPAIISPKDFERVQAMLDKRKNAPGQFKAKREYLLTGLVRCGLCSHTYVGHEKTIRGNKYRYYECSGAYSKGPKTKCKNAHLNADLLEDAVINTLLDNITQHDVDDILSDAAKMINNNTKVQEKKKILLAKRNGLQERMNNLYKILETTGSPDEYDIARLNDIKTELRSVDHDIAELQLMPELKVTKEELMESWQEFVTTLKEKTDLTRVKSVLMRTTSVVVMPDELIITINVAGLLVPGTGIEPVRVSLPAGF